jgi:hypothetical protein
MKNLSRKKSQCAKAEPTSELESSLNPESLNPRVKNPSPKQKPMTLRLKALQSVFDRAFAGISQVREAFTPQLTPHEVGTIISFHRHRQGLRPPRRGL